MLKVPTWNWNCIRKMNVSFPGFELIKKNVCFTAVIELVYHFPSASNRSAEMRTPCDFHTKQWAYIFTRRSIWILHGDDLFVFSSTSNVSILENKPSPIILLQIQFWFNKNPYCKDLPTNSLEHTLSQIFNLFHQTPLNGTRTIFFEFSGRHLESTYVLFHHTDRSVVNVFSFSSINFFRRNIDLKGQIDSGKTVLHTHSQIIFNNTLQYFGIYIEILWNINSNKQYKMI